MSQLRKAIPFPAVKPIGKEINTFKTMPLEPRHSTHLDCDTTVMSYSSYNLITEIIPIHLN